MNSTIRKLTTVAAVAFTFAALSGNALADTKFQQNHPRRAQVNSRLNNQNLRINTEVKDGQISRGQASVLHTDDHEIRTEERDMASQNNTHITRQEQATLNAQENGVSKLIGK